MRLLRTIAVVMVAAIGIYFVTVGATADLISSYEALGIVGLIALFVGVLGLALVVHGDPTYRLARYITGGALLVLGGGMLGLQVFVWSSEAVVNGPTLRSWSSASTTGEPVLSLPTPSGIEADDILIAQVHGRGRAPITAPQDWKLIKGVESHGDNMQSFWKRATSTEPTHFDFDAGHVDGKGGGITAWRGIDLQDPIADTSVQTVVGKRQIVVPSVTTAAPNSPLVLMVGAIGKTAIMTPADMEARWTEVSPESEYVSTTTCSTSVHGLASPSGEKLAAAGQDGFGGSVAQLVALRPAETP